jgi:DNA repair exonuclease SbcCD ATPase subunit
MAAKPKVYRMTLSEYHRYLDDKHRELEACYKDVEEVQMQFNDIFKRELAAWQERFAFCFPRVGAQRRELPAEFVALIDRTEAEERARLEKEIADLDQQIKDGRAKMDELLAKAQAETEALRTANPELNAREEKLKGLVVRYQDEYAKAFEALEKLGGLSWLLSSSKRGKLQKAQRQAKARQAQHMQQLQTVRQEWQDKLKQTGETQAALREEWQKTSVSVSQAETRREHLHANLNDLAEQAALQRVLEELKEPPDVPGELGEALKDLVQRNHVRWAYEEGLRAVAETLGLLKGVGEGLKRFQKSLATVLQEQRRYNLKEVHAQISEFVVALLETWKALQAQVKDEKLMGKNPLDFSRIVDRYVKERLTDTNIQRLFEEMGEALNQATAAWK